MLARILAFHLLIAKRELVATGRIESWVLAAIADL